MATRRDGDVIAYRSRRAYGGAHFAARYRVGAELGPAVPGTFEHFAVERYRLCSRRGRRLYSGQVRHRPYPLHAAELLELDESVLGAAGLPAAGGPAHVLFSPGVEVGLGPRTRCGSAVHLDGQERPDRVGGDAVGRRIAARAHQQHQPRLL
jgi:uncharacterized protein YqjF (DUF2071 family)